VFSQNYLVSSVPGIGREDIEENGGKGEFKYDISDIL
jgi:hypothetical protein